MARPQLMFSHFVDFGVNSGYKHSVGGTHQIEGAWCPNCDKPLMLHMTVDTGDLTLELERYDLGLSTLPLLYCNRCSLSWYDFSYVIKSETEIKMIEFFTGETDWDDWNAEVGMDVIPYQACSFRPMPPTLQELFDVLNSYGELSDEANDYVLEMTGKDDISVINQVGGRAYIAQELLDPVCVNCKMHGVENEMIFFASLTNDRKNGAVFSYDGDQIVFFFCPVCRSMKVINTSSYVGSGGSVLP